MRFGASWGSTSALAEAWHDPRSTRICQTPTPTAPDFPTASRMPKLQVNCKEWQAKPRKARERDTMDRTNNESQNHPRNPSCCVRLASEAAALKRSETVFGKYCLCHCQNHSGVMSYERPLSNAAAALNTGNNLEKLKLAKTHVCPPFPSSTTTGKMKRSVVLTLGTACGDTLQNMSTEV